MPMWPAIRDDEQRKWLRRRGRFDRLEKDTPERQQVMPVEEPPAERQTHVTD